MWAALCVFAIRSNFHEVGPSSIHAWVSCKCVFLFDDQFIYLGGRFGWGAEDFTESVYSPAGGVVVP